MFLSGEIFSWPFDAQDRDGLLDHGFYYRSYEIWRHAKKHLEGEPDELHRVDCISALRRAINHRLKSLNSAYRLDRLPTSRSKKQTLENLQDYGLIRPALIKELLNVRNAIEHEDAPPPETAQCHHFVDIVWYFLKSTDDLMNMRTSSIFYEEDGNQSELSIFVFPENDWTVRVSGKIRADLLLDAPDENALQLVDPVMKRIPRKKGFITLEAGVLLNTESLKLIAREYFSSGGYWHEDA